MSILNVKDYNILSELGRINLIVGKNGSGKSRLLREIDQQYHGQENAHIRYITPERGGNLQYQANVENGIQTDESWLANQRRHNQHVQFREASVSQYRELELLTLREIENDPEVRKSNASFDQTISGINDLLDNIEMLRSERGFALKLRSGEERVRPNDISSGEAEIISLAIECAVFAKECKPSQLSVLLLDEPDLHMHPDLQYRFARFVDALSKESGFKLMLATHSTALVSAFSEVQDAHIAFKKSGQSEVDFQEIGEPSKKILPVFGAHPLSNVFNESPIFLVEGEDDERIWQQAYRSSRGKLRIYPISVGGKGYLDPFEKLAREIIESVYDNARGFSLRDGDDASLGEEIADLEPLRRFRLKCRSAENLILTDEVLKDLGSTWESLRIRLEKWEEDNPDHEKTKFVTKWRQGGFDRRFGNLKEIRNIIMALSGSEKPWEVAVGQIIGRLTGSSISLESNSIGAYLGEKLIASLLTPMAPSAINTTLIKQE